MNRWKKQKHASESTSIAVANLLTALKVKVNLNTVQRCIDTHYASGSLMSIVHALGEWGVVARPSRLDYDHLVSVETPALVHIKDHEDENAFVVLVKSGEKITYVDSLAGEVTLAANEFIKIATGVVLLPEVTDYSGESEFDKRQVEQRAKSVAKALRLGFLVALPVLALMLAWVKEAAAIVVFAVLCNAFGMLLCEMLSRIQNGQAASLLKRLCGTDPSAGCHSVLAHPIAKPFGLYSLSEIGMVYFLACQLLLVLSLTIASAEMLALAVLLLGVMSFPAIASLIYLQYSMHQWCRLCLVTHALLCFEFLVGVGYLIVTDATLPGWQEWSMLVIGIFSTCGVWLLATTDRLNSVTTEADISFGKIVSDPENFDLFLEPMEDLPELSYKITQSTPKAEVFIKVYAAVGCHHCRLVHLELEKYIHHYPERVSLEIVLLVSDEYLSIEVSKIIYGLAKHRSPDAAYKAYVDWIQYEKMDQEKLRQWQSQYGLHESEYLSDDALQQISFAIDEAGIESTPLITVNDGEVLLEGGVAVHAIGRWMRKNIVS